MLSIKLRTLRHRQSLLFISSLALGAAVLPSPAMALDFSPDASRILSDPAYLPLQGQIVGASVYAQNKITGDVYNDSGVLNRSFTATTDSLNQSFAYGISDDLALSLSEAYAWHKTVNDYPASPSKTTNSDGLVDPRIGVTWRVFDQRQHRINWDLLASYAPDMFNAKGSSPTQDGTVARGGQVANVGTAISYETRDFTVYANVVASYLGSRDILNANGTTTSYQSTWQHSFALNTQTRLTPSFAINLGMAQVYNNGANGTNDTTKVSFNNDPGTRTDYNVALIKTIRANTLAIALTYNHDNYGTSRSEYPAQPSSNTTAKNESADQLGAKLLYVF